MDIDRKTPGLLQIKREITLGIDETSVKSRLTKFLSDSGYKKGEGNFTFKRGSKKANWYAQNPAKLYSVYSIEIEPGENSCDIRIILEFDISWQTNPEELEAFWKDELIRLEAYLNNPSLEIKDPVKLGSSVTRQYLRILVEILATGLLGGFISIGLAFMVPHSIGKYIVYITILVLILAYLFVHCFLIKFFYRDKKS